MAFALVVLTLWLATLEVRFWLQRREPYELRGFSVEKDAERLTVRGDYKKRSGVEPRFKMGAE